jgi:DNA polymerase
VNAAQAHDLIELSYGPVMALLSKAVRAQFVARRGKKFYGADFSNIEGRINAWFAGEQWKLDYFRDYDLGRVADIYVMAYSRAFGEEPGAVNKAKRKLGKYQELSGGYQGSVGAWLRFDPHPDIVVKVTKDHFSGSDAWEKAAKQYDRERYHHDLTPDQWIAIKVNSNLWRESNRKITASWWEVQDAAMMAVESPGTKVTALDNKIAYMVDSGFLWCSLPSGKLLAYARPRLVEMKEEWIVGADGDSISINELEEAEVAARLAAGAKIEKGRTRTQVAFDGKRKSGSWGTCYLYGGLQCNNYTQATARELLRFAMHNIETAGYPIVLHVHDETVSEVDETFGSVEEYRALMSIVPPWLPGFPLAAKAWTDTRYVK